MELLTQQSSASILCGCFCAPVSMEISSGGVAAPIAPAAASSRANLNDARC